MVMGGDSCFKGRGFESRHTGRTFFNCNDVCLKRPKNTTQKRPGCPFFIKKTASKIKVAYIELNWFDLNSKQSTFYSKNCLLIAHTKSSVGAQGLAILLLKD